MVTGGNVIDYDWSWRWNTELAKKVHSVSDLHIKLGSCKGRAAIERGWFLPLITYRYN